jgi:hypothetical protein
LLPANPISQLRASLRSVFTGIVDSAVFTCRVSSSPASAKRWQGAPIENVPLLALSQNKFLRMIPIPSKTNQNRIVRLPKLMSLPQQIERLGREHDMASVELMRTPMSWRDELNPGCDLHQVLYRDDGEVLGCVLRLEGDPSIYAHTVTHDALRRLGAHPTVDAARRAVERAIGTEEGELWLFERVTRPAGRSRGRTLFRP